MDLLIILAGALAIDLLVGEPPLFVHPVVWMGKFTSLWQKGGSRWRPTNQFIYGTAMTLITAALFAVPTYLILAGFKYLDNAASLVVGMILLKTTFSLGELRRAALKIKRLLADKKLDEARFGLRALVKRDAWDLPEHLIVSATVESVAENASDSFVAPLFYFLLFGVPGAMAYRVINTLDAMIGYHGKYEYLGKFAAWLDTVANLIPARLTALLIVLAAFLSRKNGRASWRVMLSDHARTSSPNAGWPMSAAAGALEVQLEKVSYYKLGRAGKPLEPKAVDAMLGLLDITSLLWVITCFGVNYVVSTA